jgi:hypothetical protein
MASFKTPDGKWRLRSTKTADRNQAKEIARGWEQASLLGAEGKLTAPSHKSKCATGY